MADTTDERSYRVFAVELGDDAGPRRRADRPNLYIGITPHADLQSVLQSKRHRLVREHGTRLLPALTRSYPATTEDDARRQLTKLRLKLTRQGYSVNGNSQRWHVYVIELSDGVGPRDNPRFPWVYVGETSKTPEERFQEHVTGARNKHGRLYSPVAKKHGLRLMPELYVSEPAHYTAADSKQAEAAMGDRLRTLGYSVCGAH